MKFYSSKINKLILFCIFNTGLLINGNAIAECGILKFQGNKSSGVVVKGNNCSEESLVSLGTVFELAPRGRLWLKSVSARQAEPKFQLICQNRSIKSLQLDFSDKESPWLNLSKLNACSGWVNNKLSCNAETVGKSGVYCVISFVKKKSKDDLDQVARTTSVKMRSLNFFGNRNKVKKEILEIIKPELQMCKQVNQVSQNIKIEWAVQSNRKVSGIEIFHIGKNKRRSLFQCLSTVVSTFEYPSFSKEMNFESIF